MKNTKTEILTPRRKGAKITRNRAIIINTKAQRPVAGLYFAYLHGFRATTGFSISSSIGMKALFGGEELLEPGFGRGGEIAVAAAPDKLQPPGVKGVGGQDQPRPLLAGQPPLDKRQI